MRQIYISRPQQFSSAPEDSPDASPDLDIEAEIELPIDMARQGGHLVIQTPMIGAKNEEISITVNNDILYIHKAAHYHEEEFDNYYVQECHWGSLAREIQLPVAVDPTGAKASLQDGILKIILPIMNDRKTRIIKIR